MSDLPGLVFGIYPFSAAGMAGGLANGPADDYARLPGLIDQLRGGREFILRGYVHYADESSVEQAMRLIEFCARSRMPWDMVVGFHHDGMALDGWTGFVREIVRRYGNTLAALQITNEPNLLGLPDAGDGSRPAVREALVQGVLAARDEVTRLGATVSIGFNAVPTLHGANDFWTALKRIGGAAFAQAIDYVGLDIYPDVFGPPIPVEHLPAAVEHLLLVFRTESLSAAGISAAVPMRITENGWPTGPDRSPERQAGALEAIIRAVHRLRGTFNVTHYELFGLRDANSSNANFFHQFGILCDDYSPKPAFDAYRRLIQELGR